MTLKDELGISCLKVCPDCGGVGVRLTNLCPICEEKKKTKEKIETRRANGFGPEWD